MNKDATCMDAETINKSSELWTQDILQNIYTVQFKGVYLFTYSALASSVGKNYAKTTVIELLKNGQVMSASHLNPGLATFEKYPIEIKATMKMEPGDQVSINYYSLTAGDSLNIGGLVMNDVVNDSLHLELSYTTFSGFQLASLH